MLPLSEVGRLTSEQSLLKLNGVFKILKYDKLLSAQKIVKRVRIGDAGLTIGGGWVIGGYSIIDGASSWISYNTGTTTRITQALNPERAQGTSVTQFVVSVLDMGESMSELISPSFVLDDVLGEECEYAVGFADTAYPEDYARVLRGVIEGVESGAGFVNFLISSNEYKKFQPLFIEKTTELSGAIGNGAITTLNLVDASQFPVPYSGPFGVDPDVEYLVRVDDELFRYTGISGNQLTGVTRAYMSTQAVAHDDQATVTSVVRLTGNTIDLAIKIMMSGLNGPFAEDIKVSSFNYIDPSNTITDTIYFKAKYLKTDYGLQVGDLISITGSPTVGNNLTNAVIGDIVETNNGTYILITGAGLTTAINDGAVAAFRSQFDSLGYGLKMTPEDVDVEEHIKVRDRFLSVFDQDILMAELPNTKDFIEQVLYKSSACFSVPRKARASLAIHVGPVPDNEIKILNVDNVINPDQLRLKRSLSTNFYNKVVYKYDHDFITDKYKTSKEFESDESKARISDIDKIWQIDGRGIRTSNGGFTKATQTQRRILGRYRFGAEYIENVKVLFSTAFRIEIGDIVLVDFASLKMTDILTGNRSGNLKFMSVLNKSYDSKTAECSLKLVNTSFGLTDRFGLVAPASKCDTGSTASKIKLQKSFGTKFYQTEGYKWRNLKGQKVLVYKKDWTEFAEATLSEIDQFADPTYALVSPALPFVPGPDHIMGPPNYGTSGLQDENAVWKARYAYLSPEVQVASGTSQTVFDVGAGDAAKFLVDAIVQVHLPDYSVASPEAKVLSVSGTTITVDTALGFIPNNSHRINLIGFSDKGYAYRYI